MKSPASAPVKLIVLIVTAELPLLVRVADFCPPALPTMTEPHVMDEGRAVTLPPCEVAPVPENETVSGVAELLSVSVQVADSAPTMLGWKVIFAAQLAEAARDAPHVVDVWMKSPAFVPVMDAGLRVTALDVVLVTVMGCGPLAEPVFTVPKERLSGAAVTLPDVPPVPVPETAISWGLVPSLSV